VVSQYRFRGFSMSDRRPAISLNLAYDHSSGAYVGGSAVAADTDIDGTRALGFMGYAGYVRRIKGETALDLGVSRVDIDRYNDGRRQPLRYTEVYAGVTGKALSLHAYYSPNYIRPGWHTLYFDLSGAVRPADKWRAFAHGGLYVATNEETKRLFYTRWDTRVGVSRELGPAEFQLAWVYSGPAQEARPGLPPPPPRSTLILGASYFF
jgi:uncharacterized protein (TIGR02001 family)